MIAAGEWTDIASATAGSIAALIGGMAAFVAWITYRTQSDPQVIVYAALDPNRDSCMLITVENIGKGVARNVRFELSRQLPSLNYIGENARAAAVMTTGPLISGIPFLEPGGKRTCFWGFYPDLFPVLGIERVGVVARYKGDGLDAEIGRQFESKSILEIGSFQFTDGILFNHLKRIADATEKLVAEAQRRSR